MFFYNIFAPAKVLYEPFRVEYKDEVYVIYDFKEPYDLVDDGYPEDNENRVYVKDCIVPFIYFEPYSESFDKNINFIALYNYDEILIKENFVFPTIENNEIHEVWMSLDILDNKIKDANTVNRIVECAKSNGEIGLDKDIYDYLKENSWDNHCIYLKYEGYPLVEEFFITETDDGRYIIDQYTAEEYDTIYWDEPAHQF